MKMTEEQRRVEINKVRKTRAEENRIIEILILELPKKRISNEQRKAELNALVKRRAMNNAEAKAKLMALGVKYATRKPPPRPSPCNCDLTVSQVCCCDSVNCQKKEKEEIGGIKEQASEMLEHIEKLVSYQAKPNAKPPQDISVTESGKPDSTEISKVRCEVAEIQGAMNMLARFLATQNVKVIDPQPYIHKLAHMEAVTCCQARVPYNAVPHKYVQVTPQVMLQPNGQPDNSEIDKVRAEVREVKNAVKSLSKSFDSYNMGKMHGNLESLKASSAQPIIYPQQQSQPQVQPIIVNTPQPQQVQTQPIIMQAPPQQNSSGQPVVINNSMPGFTQPETQVSQPQSESQQHGSSGLAEMLAKMSEKLDGLTEDMK